MSSKIKSLTPKPKTQSWLLPYSGFLTLVVGFFVILYSKESEKLKKFTQAASEVGSTLGSKEDQNRSQVSSEGKKESALSQKDLETLRSALQESFKLYLGSKSLEESMQMAVEPRGLLMRLEAKSVFEDKGTKLSLEGERLLREFSRLIKNSRYMVQVEGFSDYGESKNSKTGYDLSYLRAKEVAEFFIQKENFDPSKMVVAARSSVGSIVDSESRFGSGDLRKIQILLFSEKK